MDKLQEVIKAVTADVPDSEDKIKAAIKKVHGKMSKVAKYTTFEADVRTYTEATFTGQINTRAFRSTSFRQGAAVSYEELKKPNPADKPNPAAGEEKKGEDEADIRPALLKHFKQLLKQDLVRALKISGCSKIEECHWELDYPKFETALYRAFGAHISCYGQYAFESYRYLQVEKVILDFLRHFKGAPHTAGEWAEAKLESAKTFLSLVFDLGFSCQDCGESHIDFWDHKKECSIEPGSHKEDSNDTHTLQ